MPKTSSVIHWMLLTFATVLLLPACEEDAHFVQHSEELVDPFIGTGGHGHTFPGATMPFGMVQLSPDTRLEGWDGCSGYHDSDSVIYGFSHTHLSGTGVSDYGDVLLMPMPQKAWDNKGALGYPSQFEKASEKAGAGWYEVELAKGGIQVALTATERCGFHRYTFAQDSAFLLIDLRHRDPVLQSSLRRVGPSEVEGYRYSSAWARDQRIYFVAQFSAPILGAELRGDSVQSDSVAAGKAVVGLLEFDARQSKQVLVKVGISAVSIAGARSNLTQEIPAWDFEGTKKAATAAWQGQLGKIEIAGGTAEQQRIFYSALYHTSIVPNLFSDVDGQYRGMDGTTHSAQDSQYTVFSLWDTYRAAHPLYTLIEQERTGAFIRSFLRMYQDGGRLPVWELAGNETECMIGYHSVSVIADAYGKGLRNFDAGLALQAMVHGADLDHFGLEFYKRQGHIGAGDEAESVSKTLEYAYDDWCIAEMAHALGQDSIAARFYQRAQYYKNLFDPQTGFFRAKLNGCWQEPFDPREVNFNFTEANAWQYSLAVPQDISGLIALMGGKKALENHLDKLFTAETRTTGREQADITGLIGQYAHGNEPSHHMAWLYNFTDAPHKTSARVRQILTEMYHAAPDGLSGNEDCGQMSAWYVMSAMGLYAVTPGRPEYHLAAPLFPHVKLHVGNGKTFEIIAQGTDQGKPYIQFATLNGQPHNSLVISHQAIATGGKLVFEMGQEANDEWAGKDPQLPVSKIDAPAIPTVPFFVARSQTFTDTLTVRIATVQAGAIVHYTRDGSQPTAASPVYKAPIHIDGQTILQAISVSPDGRQSPAARAEFFKIDPRRKVTLHTKYENQYAAGGDLALIDGLRGGPNFRTGRWQGYQGDMEVVIDLGQLSAVRGVEIGCLQDINSWIWMPRQVDVYVSGDGNQYERLGSITPKTLDTKEGAQIEYLKVNATRPQLCRYIKVKATNYGVCPPWHLGAGGRAWIFVDEIVIL